MHIVIYQCINIFNINQHFKDFVFFHPITVTPLPYHHFVFSYEIAIFA